MTLPGEWSALLRGCDEAQLAAITSPAIPLLVIAGAGSGKTRVLTRRIAWRIVEEQAVSQHVLALTFTRKAAGELRSRLRALGLPSPVTAGTFHAIALAQLRRRAMERGERPPAVLESKTRLLSELVSARGRLAVPALAAVGRERIGLVAAEIEWAKARRVTPSAYEAAAQEAKRALPVPLEALIALYEAYEREKARRRVLDFDDLLASLTTAIQREPDFAAAQRWQFAHLFVDELQDASSLQLDLVSAWLGTRRDLFAVGDPRQSVYAWNGADPHAVSGFSTRFAGATVLELSTNYRSTPQVVSLASALLPRHGERIDLRLPVADRPDGTLPTLSVHADEVDEARALVRSLRNGHGADRPWRAFAVLARTNTQLQVVAQALDAARIPHSEELDARSRRPGIQRALAGMAALSGAVALSAYAADLRDAARTSAAERADTDDNERVEHSREEDTLEQLMLADLLDEYIALDAAPSGDGFVAYLRAGAPGERLSGRRDVVELSTFHRAKGLEWPVVFVVGLEDGFSPISYAKSREALAEEQRLLYVALTRALDELHCSYAATRRFAERVVTRRPSPYLEALEGSLRALERQRTPGAHTVTSALAESRAVLEAANAAREAAASDRSLRRAPRRR